jgi:hypothetical protein
MQLALSLLEPLWMRLAFGRLLHQWHRCNVYVLVLCAALHHSLWVIMSVNVVKQNNEVSSAHLNELDELLASVQKLRTYTVR